MQRRLLYGGRGAECHKSRIDQIMFVLVLRSLVSKLCRTVRTGTRTYTYCHRSGWWMTAIFDQDLCSIDVARCRIPVLTGYTSTNPNPLSDSALAPTDAMPWSIVPYSSRGNHCRKKRTTHIFQSTNRPRRIPSTLGFLNEIVRKENYSHFPKRTTKKFSIGKQKRTRASLLVSTFPSFLPCTNLWE